MKELILVTDSNYVTFIILNIIFIAIATITIMLFINEKNKKVNNKIQELEKIVSNLSLEEMLAIDEYIYQKKLLTK